MPAQSPTLSPTLSAIVAGLRGASSGIPFSILPTRSAPTSAALVKMPPPLRLKRAANHPPNQEGERHAERKNQPLVHPAVHEKKTDRDGDDKPDHSLHLTRQVGKGPLLDGGGYPDHRWRSRIFPKDPKRQQQTIPQGDKG